MMKQSWYHFNHVMMTYYEKIKLNKKQKSGQGLTVGQPSTLLVQVLKYPCFKEIFLLDIISRCNFCCEISDVQGIHSLYIPYSIPRDIYS